MIVKRIFDVVFALILLVVLSPLMIVIAIAILITMGRPIFFLQERPGLYGKPFKIIKFRTLNKEVKADISVVRDHVCDLYPHIKNAITPFGFFLRSYSLDELPQLINILKGDMSFVGPRPLLMEHMDIYTDEQKKRHNVRPGVTGLAQVEGRKDISWEQRMEKDLYYISKRSFFLDLKILLYTLLTVIKRQGVSEKK